MKGNRALLRKLLQVFVNEWGHKEVTEVLESITHSPIHPTLEGATKTLRRAARVRLSAIQQTEQAGLEGEKRQVLLRLAERYDSKQFLPNVADVREFLTMMDEKPLLMKDRKDAFRVLLRSLVGLPVERLQRLALSAQHSGPAQLGPLSDAIAAAGERLPRQRQASHTTPEWGRPVFMPTIFFDTNVLRYFAKAFSDASIDLELKQHFAVSPISLLEVLSELATNDADEAFRTIRTFPNIFDTDRLPLLPWEDDVFRTLIFNLPQQPQSQLPELLGNATRRVFHSSSPADVEKEAQQLRDMMDRAKYESTEDFAKLLDSWRANGGVTDLEHRRIFATSIANRAGVPQEGVDVNHVISKLDVLWAYEYQRVTNAAAEKDYNPHRHENDFYDAQQLIYLAQPDIHFLTCDRGFRKSADALQYKRVHWEPTHVLENAEQATRSIRKIIETSKSNPDS
jgi:hypothetical protein